MGSGEERYPLVEVYDEKLGRTVWLQPDPEACPNGHPWVRGAFRRGWLPCGQHDGHNTWTCKTCDARVLDPPHDDGELPAEQWKIFG